MLLLFSNIGKTLRAGNYGWIKLYEPTIQNITYLKQIDIKTHYCCTHLRGKVVICWVDEGDDCPKSGQPETETMAPSSGHGTNSRWSVYQYLITKRVQSSHVEK